jgi:hypothetical protein
MLEPAFVDQRLGADVVTRALGSARIYADGPERTFHPIAPEVDLDAAIGMQEVPSLPLGDPEDRARIGRALIVRSRGVRVPPPEVFGLPPFASPSFELEVAGAPLDLVVELRAVYPAGRFAVGLEVIFGSGGAASHAGRDASHARLD